MNKHIFIINISNKSVFIGVSISQHAAEPELLRLFAHLPVVCSDPRVSSWSGSAWLTHGCLRELRGSPAQSLSEERHRNEDDTLVGTHQK